MTRARSSCSSRSPRLTCVISRSARPGVGREALVVLGDLAAEVFPLDLEQGLGVALLHAGDEQAQEAAEQVGDASEHGQVLLPRAR